MEEEEGCFISETHYPWQFRISRGPTTPADPSIGITIAQKAATYADSNIGPESISLKVGQKISENLQFIWSYFKAEDVPDAFHAMAAEFHCNWYLYYVKMITLLVDFFPFPYDAFNKVQLTIGSEGSNIVTSAQIIEWAIKCILSYVSSPPSPAADASMPPVAKTPQLAIPKPVINPKPKVAALLANKPQASFTDVTKSRPKPRPLAWALAPIHNDVSLVELAKAFPTLPANSITAMHHATHNIASTSKYRPSSTTLGLSHCQILIPFSNPGNINLFKLISQLNNNLKVKKSSLRILTAHITYRGLSLSTTTVPSTNDLKIIVDFISSDAKFAPITVTSPTGRNPKTSIDDKDTGMNSSYNSIIKYNTSLDQNSLLLMHFCDLINLLRTLTESNAKPPTDLRLLLNTVKEGRKQSADNKLSDAFYDALEGLLIDLKTITLDNRDAEAFLKPVSRAEVPDYYDVIAIPMDFQTMLKKVKSKQYKSKREFKDDLELIWSNCYTYNASENHPLRQCVKRLKAKADHLLKHVTDRRDRTDPWIPHELSAGYSGLLPQLNGIGRHTRSPSYSSTRGAITRTPEGMAIFYELNREVAGALKKPSQQLIRKLKDLAPTALLDGDGQDEADVTPREEDLTELEGVVGDKRKLPSLDDHNNRPRKRARFLTPYPIPLSPGHDQAKDELSELWWAAAQSDTLLANGVPPIPFGPSSSEIKARRPPSSTTPSPSFPPPSSENPKALLNLMNTNIKTMRRVRHTHGKFAALNASTLAHEEVEEGEALNAAADDEILNEKVDEKPWVMMRKIPSGGKGKGKEREEVAKVGGVDVGEKNAWGCLQWTNQKILEHVGFQGTSQIALDVMSGVLSEYISNVGRTIKFMCDKYSGAMTPEEIILHTLFESGTSKVQDLERYIRDDVERYSSRLNELEKKIVGAYRDTTAGETLEDEGLFVEEDEEETGALAIGDFADLLGEDYLGLRELGIAAEFGMSSLSIPKKLLKSKKNQLKTGQAASKPDEPPPPYPPPSPFVPLKSDKIDDQIGLLKGYYTGRFTTLAAAAIPKPAPPLPGPYGIAPLSGPSLPGPSQQQQQQPIDLASLPVLTLPDDQPTAVHAKMGPLGQIVKGGGASTGKKKSKAAASSGGAGATASAAPATTSGPANGTTGGNVSGVGTGNGRKKKGPDGSSGGTQQGSSGGQGQRSPSYPPVVVASA
ncbi:Transcriptional activator spt7 [Leucoagaricus sp. SymC.cos]|nr:Transcriptional activator spt7 [Leucoagaricus sp. SymC.cos]